jgi:glucose-1-phosphate thymidylyltransferase
MTKRAIVLARGLGRRMQQPDPAGGRLSDSQRRAADAGHKALMPVAGRPLLDFVLSALADAEVTDVALVVAPDHAAFRHYYVSERAPARVHLDFVVQEEALGTANAVLAAEAWTAGGSFLVMNSDNLYPPDVLRSLAALDEPALPVFTRDDLVRSGNIPSERLQSYALLTVDGDGNLSAIVEKPSAAQFAAAGASALVSMNCWRFDARIFRFCRDVPRSARGEFELPEAVGLAVRHGMKLRAIPGHGPVLDLSRRADAEDVERRLAGLVPRP